MSKAYSTNWNLLTGGACYRVIRGNTELLVHEDGNIFGASLSDEEGKEIWRGTYPTRAGAKRAGVAAAKRLIPANDEVIAATGTPEADAVDVPLARKEGSQSIWRPVVLRTEVEGRGLVADCSIEVGEDCVEGITKLGDYVSVVEYPDEWSAKHGVLQWATLLIRKRCSQATALSSGGRM